MTMIADTAAFVATADDTAAREAEKAETKAYRLALTDAKAELQASNHKVLGSRRLARWLGVDQRLRTAVEEG